jgi:LAGLIDADG DNA endonuclease family
MTDTELKIKKFIDKDITLLSTTISKKLGISINVVRYYRRKNNWQSPVKFTPFKKSTNKIHISKIAEDIIIGSLLGDGSMSKTISFPISKKHNSCLVIKHGIKQLQYNLYKKALLEREGFKMYFKEEKQEDLRMTKGYSETNTIRTQNNIVFNEYRKIWYPEDKKIIPKNIIINPLALAIWYMDDGCYTNGIVYLYTNGFTKEECNFLKNYLLERYNIEINVHANNVLYVVKKSHDTFF